MRRAGGFQHRGQIIRPAGGFRTPRVIRTPNKKRAPPFGEARVVYFFFPSGAISSPGASPPPESFFSPSSAVPGAFTGSLTM